MARSNRKKTDIPIPEPRHRVGPRGVSSGISFRELPPPSLDEIKKICEHYQVKCAGTYKSLASRYVYQMATEIEDLVDTLKGESGSSSIESSFLPSKKKFSRVKNANVDVDAARKVGRFHDKRLKKTAKTARHVIDSPKEMRSIGSSSEDTTHEPVRYRNVANTRKPRRSRHASTETDERREFHFDFSLDDEPHLPFNKHYVYSDDESSTDKYISTHQRRNADPLTRRNLEDQNEEVLRWLKEEMERSQSLIQRSKRMHDVEIDNAKQELEKVKKAAKSIIKAVHKKGMERAAKSEANAESRADQPEMKCSTLWVTVTRAAASRRTNPGMCTVCWVTVISQVYWMTLRRRHFNSRVKDASWIEIWDGGASVMRPLNKHCV